MLSARSLPLALLLALALSVLPAGAAHAEPTATSLSLEGDSGRPDTEHDLTVTLAGEDGTPVAGASVVVERRTGGAWAELATLLTDAAGVAATTAVLSKRTQDNVFRARYDGDADHLAAAAGPVQVGLVKRDSKVVLAGPGRVVDERSVRLRIRRVTGEGEAVPGRVVLQRRNALGRWVPVARPLLDQEGRAQVRVAPRVDTRYRVQAPGLDWVRGATSAVHRLDNVPPGPRMSLPGPRPRVHLPPQRRAVGAGPSLRISGIPAGVWGRMTGRSWHSGCPVGRAQLRYLQVNYWGYDGYRHRGELVAHASAIGRMGAALAAMHRRRLPIRSMYLVDRFGWSSRLQGADDYRSMAAGNTSAFNCRWVVGRPGVRSPHSYGRSLDLNPWENPYRASHGWVPNAWWVGRSHPRVAWRSSSHPVVALMRAHGLRWTYGRSDNHHFDVAYSSGRVRASGGRIAARPDCDERCS